MIHSFLMLGQSNMAGRGLPEEVEAIENARIKVLRNGRWQPMYVPVNADRPFSGISLAESFADAYAKAHDVEVGLIPCADGGTSLEDWKEGGLLYEHAVGQARLALRTSKIAGILWHQGESDCAPELYQMYQDKMESFMRSFRKELALDEIPFIIGGLGDFLEECVVDPYVKNYRYINRALENVAREQKNTGFVSAEGLTSNPDYLHFNSKSLREFGLRYYQEYEKIKERG